MLNSPHEYQKMKDVEGELWWYRCLHEFVLESLVSNIGSDASILDAGCGTGGLLRVLKENGYSNLRGFDASDHALAYAAEHARVIQGKLEDIDSHFCGEKFNAIICNDVFYFVCEEHRVEVLEKLHRRLEEHGICIVNMPVYRIFSGSHDISVGLNSRISPQQMKSYAEAAGFSINNEFCWPFFLSPLIAIARLIQRVRISFNPDTPIESDIDLPVPLINNGFYRLTMLQKTLNKLGIRLWGSSYFLVLKKSSK